MHKYYTGVGSRKTPNDVLILMSVLSTRLELNGWVLRTGDAKGADMAFANGVENPIYQEIYTAKNATKDSIAYASKFHPAWNQCSEYARKLHGRNVFQVLGKDFSYNPLPSSFLVCWTPDGCISAKTRSIKTGGTATAIVIAEAWNIPIFNLAIEEHKRRIEKYVND